MTEQIREVLGAEGWYAKFWWPEQRVWLTERLVCWALFEQDGHRQLRGMVLAQDGDAVVPADTFAGFRGYNHARRFEGDYDRGPRWMPGQEDEAERPEGEPTH